MPGNAELLERNALRIEHPEQVVIGSQQQLGRVAERFVAGEPRRIGVTVRADDRQAGDGAIEFARDCAGGGIRGKQPVGMQIQRSRHGDLPKASGWAERSTIAGQSWLW